MLFTLEALQAKKGDALLLHVGDPDDPTLVVIDGGPSGVYNHSLRPRLEAIREARTPDEDLPIPLMMISHIDDDHIRGIQDLTDKMLKRQADQEPKQYQISTLWHNSFDDLVGGAAGKLTEAAMNEVSTASTEDESLATDNVSHDGGLMLASVTQGRKVRKNCDALGITLNSPFGGLITTELSDEPIEIDGIPTLRFIVVGPPKERVETLKKDWAKNLPKILAKEKAKAEAAAYADESVYNLASIVVFVECDGKSMLLTGDGRGDDTILGAVKAGIVDKGGNKHLDILKLPHHGSIRNVELDFFQTFTADHYVVSGNGEHGNPKVDTMKLIFESREGDDRPFTIHLTYDPSEYKPFHGSDYPVADLQAVFDAENAKGTPFKVVTPADGDVSLKVDLIDEYDWK